MARNQTKPQTARVFGAVGRSGCEITRHRTQATWLGIAAPTRGTGSTFNPSFSTLSCYLRQTVTQYFVSGLLHPLE